MTLNKQKITVFYIATCAVAVLSSWVLHELAHWATGTALGYEMGMTLNKTFSANGYKSEVDYQLVSAAGPLFTILQALLFFIVLTKSDKLLWYPFLFTCFYMRLFAAVISVRNPNDEARLSDYLGLGRFTLPIIVAAFLFLLVYSIARRKELSLRFSLVTLALIILFSSIIILADQYFHPHLL